MINKQWALAWLSEMDRIEKYHATDKGALSDGSWIEKNEAIKMLIEAESILKAEFNKGKLIN